VIDYDAEIERIAGGPPGKVAFRALCALICRAGNPPELVAWCEERIASWPDEEREAPWSWLAALKAGYSRPGWALARSLAPNALRCGVADVALPDPAVAALAFGTIAPRPGLGDYMLYAAGIAAVSRAARVGSVTRREGPAR
jgi:hypothetical protein